MDSLPNIGLGALHKVEPIGTVVPRLTSGDDIRTVQIRKNLTITMMCPMQAFPIPKFRTCWKRSTKTISRYIENTNSGGKTRQKYYIAMSSPIVPCPKLQVENYFENCSKLARKTSMAQPQSQPHYLQICHQLMFNSMFNTFNRTHKQHTATGVFKV
nr:unnamed protein product [Callosobruchus chinensis]